MKFLKKFRMFENNSPLLGLQNNVDKEMISKIQKLIPTSSNILEISCGNAADAFHLKSLGYDVTCTETNVGYFDNANMYLDCILHDTAKPFPFNDNEFDLVYSRLGLHYFTIEELDSIFKELYRITREYLVFSVKLINSDEKLGQSCVGSRVDKNILDEEAWDKIVSKYFKNVECETKEGKLYGKDSKWLEIIASK